MPYELTVPDKSTMLDGAPMPDESMMPDESTMSDESMMTPMERQSDGTTEEIEQLPSQYPGSASNRIQQVGAAVGTGLSRVGELMLPSGPSTQSDTTEANGDDLSDLFAGPRPDDPDMNIDDLVAVDDEDVFGEGGNDMSDLFDVPDESNPDDMADVLGLGSEDDLSDLFDIPADLFDITDPQRKVPSPTRYGLQVPRRVTRSPGYPAAGMIGMSGT
jgi:hypothetical protein